MTNIPHFVLPLRFERGAAVTVEQDTSDDIASCVVAVLLCPLGMRTELPEFGVLDPAFSMGEVDTDQLATAVRRWEPRADVMFEQEPDLLDVLVQHVRGNVAAPSAD
jgi:phage baseplate assembly protein W